MHSSLSLPFANDASANGVLVRGLWPHQIGSARTDTRDVLDLHVYQLVPETFDDLIRTYYTFRQPSRGVGRTVHKLAFTPDVSPGLVNAVVEPVFRFQGVVQDAVLGPAGNWNGNVMNCAKAGQRLVVKGIAGNEAFEAMQTQLAGLREYIYASLHCRPARQPNNASANSVTFSREVFAKVIPGDAGLPAVTVHHMDDQDGRLARVEHMWRVVHQIRCGVQDNNGVLRPARYLAIRRGDFVDVAATIKIVVSHKSGRKDISIQLQPQQVFRLCSAAEMTVRTS
ncbi:hypothetical protein BDW22DRAFT_1333513 [Trametopsis cervina]|nr:hypothetical protein BDW22DRAFT_1333513 [Trametopsis cervina]